MTVTPSLGTILVTAASLTVASLLASGVASGEPAAERDDRRIVVQPMFKNTGASLELASLGVGELMPDDGDAVPVLHIRAAVTNTGRDRAWAIDASKARLELAGTVIAPAFVNSALARLPIAILDPGEHHVIDLYFPLRDEALRDGLRTFALSWPVHAPEQLVWHAWFERDTAAARPARDLAFAVGAAATWWFDPKYPWSSFLHRRGWAVPRPPSHVSMTRSPRWEPGDQREQPARDSDCDEW